MSVNFGYNGYGMMNNMNSMQNSGMNGGANTFQSTANQYNCPMCYQYGPVPYNYQTFVNPLPQNAIHPNWFNRIMSKFFGI